MGDYNTLLADVPAWVENHSIELASALPTIVLHAQTRLARAYRAPCFNAVVTGSLTSREWRLPVPARFLRSRHLEIEVAGEVRALQKRRRGWLVEYWPRWSTTAQPKYYAVETASLLRVAPTPDAAYAYEFGYRQTLPDLTVAEPSNWLTENAYDLLAAAACVEAALFVHGISEDTRAAAALKTFSDAYEARLAEANAALDLLDRDEFSGGN